MSESKPLVELTGVTKRFGQMQVLSDINLNIQRGEIVTLLGPSGCGKSTLMRLIAGFDPVSGGKIVLDGVDMSRVPPEKRPVNMVFQRYALFPHLDVFDNVAFGLRLKKLPRDEIRKKTTDMLELVQLSGFADRWISQISGGQAQRVALARALVNQPLLLLLDEPLAALDLKIRQHMLKELKRIHTETGITFLYVTHDQDEAMILSDRIVLMNKGRIEQIGTPEQMYSAPQSLFCAKFLGETNIIPCKLQGETGRGAVFGTSFGTVSVADTRGKTATCNLLSIRPESINVTASHGSGRPAANRFDGMVDDLTFIGSRIVYAVRLADGTVVNCQEHRGVPGAHFVRGDAVSVHWPEAAVVALSGD
ncbi:ABC transporter ATP-binding protein [Fuscibacter oryzae]|uniref:Spermidine/putrescine import ATP-binding protein PotA n=1 Tax=Fuscibacter oryzae TaxID=2803939 RepID=A0A8J7MSQ4_9RHOB|nr:ABC transporter ATP-binding protein [Fuscibacter oryzae]MBL4929413.1 ABC transporter ATP-binding protein [Fuscibacter oryzae]